jgi:DNA-binding NtrC family response regulator
LTRYTAVKTVLILDADLGFLFWLGKTLDSAGYRAVPAESVSDAEKLLEEVRLTIDLLIADPTLDGASEFAHSLKEAQGHLQIIAVIGSEAAVEGGFRRVEAVVRKSGHSAETTLWLDTIRRVLLGNVTTH